MDLNPALTQIASNVRGVIFDVDGVLTNGQLTYSDDGHEYKTFHVQDGASIKLLQQHNIVVGIITGRRSPTVARRARELDIRYLIQGADSKAEGAVVGRAVRPARRYDQGASGGGAAAHLAGAS